MISIPTQKYIPQFAKPEINGKMIAFEAKAAQIIEVCDELYHRHCLPLKLMTAVDSGEASNRFKIIYVFGVPRENYFIAPYIRLGDAVEYPSLVGHIHEVSWYERKINSFFGLSARGHPHLQPFGLHENWPSGVFPLRKDFKWDARPSGSSAPYNFQKVEGEGIYEIPVGPVHAGIIEPGHFRFSVAGEEIILLEPLLGYKHKGIEKLFEILPAREKVRLSERVSGDSSFAHSLAFCQALEELSGCEVPERAKYLRVVYAELERLANHFNDIGFMMLDTAYTFGGSQCGRLREMLMQWNEHLTGSRFLRGVNAIGGVKKDIAAPVSERLMKDLRAIKKDFCEVIDIALNSTSLINRLEGTGKLSLKVARDHGVVGIPARALGINRDARRDNPYAAYDKMNFEIAAECEGDVYARFKVRIKEACGSLDILEQALKSLPAGEIAADCGQSFQKNSFAVGISEGWRGEIVYFVSTDAKGEISRVFPRDPSFLNWSAFPYAVMDNVVPDFPLINKSFNLSYSGIDL